MRILLMVCLLGGVAHAETPVAIANRLVAAQLDVLKDNNDTTGDAFEKLFAPDAVVMASDGGVAETQVGLTVVKAEIKGGMHAWVDSAKATKLSGGGDAAAVWISAEFELATTTQTGPGVKFKASRTVRVTELAVVSGGKWKIVAALFGTPGTPKRDATAPSEIPGKTKPGSLARMLVKPDQLAFQLRAKDETVVVFGTDKAEKGYGFAAAKKLLESWKSLKLEIEGPVREVEGATWGFVQANINWVKPGGAPYRMRALVIATRETSQPWEFRAIQFAVP